MPDDAHPNKSIVFKFLDAVTATIDAPVTFVKEKIVSPNQQQYPWYHQKFRRVPTVDECCTDDVVCQFEADQQFKRDKLVDSEILSILRQRFEDCQLYESPDNKEICAPLWAQYEEATGNWFEKYGDLGPYGTARTAYMKQKHRLIWERRHGPVGTGMKKTEEEILLD